MKLKLYIFFSILFIVALGIYVHLNTEAMYSLIIYEYTIELPISLWFVIPAVLMFVLSLGHMSFYSFLGYMKRKSVEKDIVNVKKVVTEAITGDLSTVELKHEALKPVAILLKNAQVTPTSAGVKTEDEDLDKLLAEIEKLNAGEEADFSKFKLPKTSHLEIKNAAIRLSKDEKYSEEILKRYSNEKFLVESAIKSFVSYADKKKIEKNRQYLTKEAVIELLSRYKADKNALTFPHEEVVKYIKEVKFTSLDFITVVNKLKTQVDPEELLELAFEFKRDFPEAVDAWIYINLELERLDEVNELFEASDDDEFVNFRKYLAIKNAGIKVDLDEFVK